MSDESISEIRPYLYLSGYSCLNEIILQEMGITHAVDATNFPECLRISGIEYFGVEIDDSEIADLKKYFEPAARFIRNARGEVRFHISTFNPQRTIDVFLEMIRT